MHLKNKLVNTIKKKGYYKKYKVFPFIEIDNTIKLDVVKAMAIVVLSIIILRLAKRYVIPDFKLMFGFAATRWNERLKGHFKGAYKYHNYYLTENSLKTDENSKE